MKINRYIRRIVACLTMAVATSASFFTEAQAGVELKCVSIKKTSFDDTTRTTIKYAPSFSYNGGVTISSAVSPKHPLTLGHAQIKGEVILKDNMPPRIVCSIKFNAATVDATMGNIEMYQDVLHSINMETMDAESILKQHEGCHITDAGAHSAIALLALEPSITVKDPGIQQRLKSSRIDLLRAMEARAIFTEVMTGAVKTMVMDHAIFQNVYNRLIAEGKDTNTAFCGALNLTSGEDPVELAVSNVQKRYDKLGVSINIQQFLADYYGEPISYAKLLLSKLEESDYPHYDINGSPHQLDDYVFSITQADELDRMLGEQMMAPAAKLANAVNEYEDAVKAALIDMCKTEIREEKEEKKKEVEEQKEELVKTDTVTSTGESKTIVITCDFGDNTTDENKKKETADTNKETTDDDTDAGATHGRTGFALPQLLPDTDDFRRLYLDITLYEAEKLAEIMAFVTDKERADLVSQGENSLLNRWLRQYNAKKVKLGTASDEDKDKINEIAMEIAFTTNLMQEAERVRNECIIEAYNKLYDAQFYNSESLRLIIERIANDTKIIVDKKHKKIHTLEDAFKNMLNGGHL